MGKGRRKKVMKTGPDSSDEGTDDDYMHDASWNTDGSFNIKRQRRNRPQSRDERIYGIWANTEKAGGRMRRKRDTLDPMSSMSLNFVKGEKIDPNKNNLEEELKKAEEKMAKPPKKKPPTPPPPTDELGSTRPGLGGPGLGSGGSSTDPFNLADMVPTGFSSKPTGTKAEQRFKRKRKLEDEAAKRAKKMTIQKGAGFGGWQKNTKGIGAKLMAKMGYKGGGLGKNETGRVNPVNAYLREKGAGLGSVHEQVDKSARNLEELAMQQEREKAKQEAEQEEKRKRLYAKGVSKQKPTYMTAQEMIKKNKLHAPKVVDTIVDFTKTGTGEIRSMGTVGADKWIPQKGEHVVCPQFLHNVSLLVDIAEHDLEVSDRELKKKLDKKIALEENVQRAKRGGRNYEENVQRLDEVLAIVDQMFPPESSDNMISNAHNHQLRTYISPLDLAQLSQLFSLLQTKYHREYIVFNLSGLARTLVFPKIKMQMHQWDPFQTPQFPQMILREWRPLLSAKTDANSARDLYSLLLEETVAGPMRAVITNMWRVQQPQPAVNMFRAAELFMPGHMRETMLDQLIVPKLREAIMSWMPTSGNLLHQWILPWRGMLGDERIETLFPLIRRQMSRALVRWKPSDPFGVKLIKPWGKVLPEGEMNDLYIKTICPKLEEALAGVFGVSMDSASSDPFDDVMKWEPVIPFNAFIAIMRRGFFPQWLHELHKWISRSESDLDAIAEWYSGWKKSFSPRMHKNAIVVEHLNTALDMMNCMLQDRDIPPMYVIRSVNPVLYHDGTKEPAKPKVPLHQRDTVEVTKRGATKITSLKETLELLATKHELEFYPKGRKHASGREIYFFGKRNIYFDEKRKVIFVKNADKEWEMTSTTRILKQ